MPPNPPPIFHGCVHVDIYLMFFQFDTIHRAAFIPWAAILTPHLIQDSLDVQEWAK